MKKWQTEQAIRLARRVAAEVSEHACKLAKWNLDPSMGPRDTFGTIEPTLIRAGDDRCGEVWLWCLHCQRFFQAKHVELDFLGNWQRCPFDDCQAAGFDIDILYWREGRLGSEDWPTERELYLGLQYPPCHCPRCTAAREEGVAVPSGAWTDRSELN
jgi:hypothetical protein